MYKVKVSIPNQEKRLNIKDFVDNDENIYKDCKFYINEDTEEVDYWFVLENLNNNYEETRVDPRNIVYLNYETSYPKDYFLTKYMQNYLNQFTYKFGCFDNFSENYEYVPPFQPWLINSSQNSSLNSNSGRDYKFFQSLKNLEKPKNLSVFCSTKKITDDHTIRLKFVEKLKEYFDDDLDWYGHENNLLDHKWDGISHYKYHVVLENESRNNLISEKLYDSFLGLSYPFYFGAPNIYNYFPENSLTKIDIFDLPKTIDLIEENILNNTYEKNLESLIESKNIVLDEFNLFKRIRNIIQKIPKNGADKKYLKLYSVGEFWKNDVNIKQKTKHYLKRKLRLNLRNY